MKRALSLLRPSSHYAADSFVCGLRALGYVMTQSIGDLGHGDVFLTWNRHNSANDYANEAAARGATVVVAENGYFGRDWLGDTWFALALDHHNGAGRWPRDDGRRWRSFGFELEPWRTGGDEIVILPQRSIGEPGIAMPLGWAEKAQAMCGGRIRPHPGRNAEDTLRDDLSSAWTVVSWGSGAAIKALAWGIRGFTDNPKWIGAPATLAMQCILYPKIRHVVDLDLWSDERLAMFESLACAQWRIGEIESGYAFAALLGCEEFGE